MNLLKQIFSVLPEGHKEAIRTILETLKKSSLLNTDREIQFEARRLAEKIATEGSVFQPNRAEPLTVIDSGSHNENMEDAYIDLKTLYKGTSHLGNIQNKERAIIDSEFNKARAGILKLINDARVFAIRSRKSEFDDIKLVNFNISRNTSKLSPIAKVDPQSRLLKLPEILKVRNHLTRRGSKLTTINVEIKTDGEVGQLGKQFNPLLAVDSKLETFWAEVILADSPIVTTYNRWGPDENGLMTTIVNGPIARMTISYSSPEPINQIKILPFAPFPVKVLEITYRPTNSSLIRIPIKGFKVEDSLDWIEYNFPEVFCSDVEISFAQENFRNYIIRIPKHVLFATDFLSRLLEERARNLGEITEVDDISIGGNHELYQEAINDLAELLTKKDLEKSPITEIDLTGKIILSIGEALANFSPDIRQTIEEVSSYTKQLPEEQQGEIKIINKFEYVLGAREIETNYVVYSPIGNYGSEKFEPASTISHAQLEVDELQPIGNQGFPETSTEWSLEFAEDRIVSIFPINFMVDGFLPVVGERLDVDFSTKLGLSRFAANLSFVTIREAGKLLVANVDYDLVWDDRFEGRLQITISDGQFDRNKIYTIDYFAAPRSSSLDILTRFNSKRLPKPESYEGTDTDNRVQTKFFPFINYSIINSNNFALDDNTKTYRYTAPTGSYTTGVVEIHPIWVDHSGQYIAISGDDLAITGAIAGYGIADWSVLVPSFLNDPHAYFLSIPAVPSTIYEILTQIDDKTLTLDQVPVYSTGLLGNEIDTAFFFGNLLQDHDEVGYSGVLTGFLRIPYSLDVVFRDGDDVFGFDNIYYDPIDVKVGGQKATNITNYVDVEQPAFTIGEGNDNEIEFIHDGRSLYFNQSIPSSEIQVDYKWMTQYVKINCTLRSNKIINPTTTPQVNEYRLLMNTTII